MKRLFILCTLMATCQLAPAQILISDFSNLNSQSPSFNSSWNNGTANQFTQGSGFISITPVSGGNPQGDGSFDAVIQGSTPVNLTGLTTLSLTARVDSGNADSGITIDLYDSSLNVLGSTTISTSLFTSSFSTVNAPISLSGNVSDATFWTLGGDGISNNVRMSFDNLTIESVPEPSTYALLGFGLVGLGFLYHRRSKLALS